MSRPRSRECLKSANADEFRLFNPRNEPSRKGSVRPQKSVPKDHAIAASIRVNVLENCAARKQRIDTASIPSGQGGSTPQSIRPVGVRSTPEIASEPRCDRRHNRRRSRALPCSPSRARRNGLRHHSDHGGQACRVAKYAVAEHLLTGTRRYPAILDGGSIRLGRCIGNDLKKWASQARSRRRRIVAVSWNGIDYRPQTSSLLPPARSPPSLGIQGWLKKGRIRRGWTQHPGRRGRLGEQATNGSCGPPLHAISGTQQECQLRRLRCCRGGRSTLKGPGIHKHPRHVPGTDAVETVALHGQHGARAGHRSYLAAPHPKPCGAGKTEW